MHAPDVMDRPAAAPSSWRSFSRCQAPKAAAATVG